MVFLRYLIVYLFPMENIPRQGGFNMDLRRPLRNGRPLLRPFLLYRLPLLFAQVLQLNKNDYYFKLLLIPAVLGEIES